MQQRKYRAECENIVVKKFKLGESLSDPVYVHYPLLCTLPLEHWPLHSPPVTSHVPGIGAEVQTSAEPDPQPTII